MSALWAVDANLTGSDRPERIELLAVSANYFSLLGANARLGRVFGPQDQTPGFAEGVVISEVISASLAQRRFAMQFVSLFGVLALLWAGVGINGVMAYSVSQRTREIGIRLALGASNSDILRPLLRQGMLLTLTGVGISFLSAFALTRSLRSLLFGIAPNDLLTYAGLALLLARVAMLACYVPARRATRVNPLVALRNE